MPTNAYPRSHAGRETGTRRRATLRQSPQVTAWRIVQSIQEHAALGEVRDPACYSHEPATLALVRALLAQED